MGKKPVSVSLSAQMVSAGQSVSIEITSQAYTSCLWTIRRRRYADGPAEVLSFAWDEPISGLHLYGYLMDRRARRDPDWLPFSFLEAYPTIEEGHR